MTYATCLQALSDPTRRAIVDALRAGPQPVGRLAAAFPISRPAISQHLKILGDAGLVTAEADGAKRVYRLSPKGFGDLRTYLDRLWDEALAEYAETASAQAKGHRP